MKCAVRLIDASPRGEATKVNLGGTNTGGGHMRSFVIGWAAALLISTTLQAATVRISLRAFVSDPARVAALRQGVEVMKARKPSDPKSWFYQSAVHGVTPEAVRDALA